MEPRVLHITTLEKFFRKIPKNRQDGQLCLRFISKDLEDLSANRQELCYQSWMWCCQWSALNTRPRLGAVGSAGFRWMSVGKDLQPSQALNKDFSLFLQVAWPSHSTCAAVDSAPSPAAGPATSERSRKGRAGVPRALLPSIPIIDGRRDASRWRASSRRTHQLSVR